MNKKYKLMVTDAHWYGVMLYNAKDYFDNDRFETEKVLIIIQASKTIDEVIRHQCEYYGELTHIDESRIIDNVLNVNSSAEISDLEFLQQMQKLLKKHNIISEIIAL